MIENCFNYEKRKYEQAAHWEKQVRYIPVTGGRRPESGSGPDRIQREILQKIPCIPAETML